MINKIQQLQSSLDETIKYFDLPIEQLSLTYQVNKWSIKKILHHLADAEMVLHYRLKKIISEDHPTIQNFEQDDWERQLDYSHLDLQRSRAIYLLMRTENILLVKIYYATHGSKTFLHSDAGIRTLKIEMDKIALHNESHNNQIKLALNKS